MSKRKYSEVEMIGALKQMEAGRSAAEVGRELGVSKHTIYAWKAKYGGMSVSEAQRPRQLEDENQRLKKLVADLSLDKEMLKAVIEKKRVELVDRREEARWLWEHYLVSQRRVCGLMVLAESSYRYVSRRNDEPLRLRLLAAAREKPRWGYRRLQIVLDQTGEHVNHKRVYRVYREAGLMIRRKARKHLRREGSPRPALTAANQEWALDFVHDAAESGRKFRALSVVDPYTRECLALEVDTSMGSRRVTRVLEAIITERGVPQAIRSDHGPEFTSRHFLAWCAERKIEVVHIEPGKPVQNAHVESFHGKLRDECLNASWFANLFEARRKIAAWRREYNEERPHSSLGYQTPAAFAREIGGQPGCGKDVPANRDLKIPQGFSLSHSHDGGDPSLSHEILKQENRLGSEANVV